MTRIIVSLAALPATYLVGAFIAADFNPVSWGADGRTGAAFSGLFAAAFIYSCPAWWWDK